MTVAPHTGFPGAPNVFPERLILLACVAWGGSFLSFLPFPGVCDPRGQHSAMRGATWCGAGRFVVSPGLGVLGAPQALEDSAPSSRVLVLRGKANPAGGVAGGGLLASLPPSSLLRCLQLFSLSSCWGHVLLRLKATGLSTSLSKAELCPSP